MTSKVDDDGQIQKRADAISAMLKEANAADAARVYNWPAIAEKLSESRVCPCWLGLRCTLMDEHVKQG